MIFLKFLTDILFVSRLFLFFLFQIEKRENNYFSSRHDNWYSAGNVIEDRFGFADFDEEEEEEENGEEEDVDLPKFLHDDFLSNIPKQEFPIENKWKEEPLSGDEGVFYEEPV